MKLIKKVFMIKTRSNICQRSQKKKGSW